MKPIPSLLLALTLTGGPAQADGYVMGAGRWTCADVLRVADSGSASEIGQLVGWLLGFWTAATFDREKAFVDKVQAANGKVILDTTVAECGTAPGDTLLYKVSESMIRNTR